MCKLRGSLEVEFLKHFEKVHVEKATGFVQFLAILDLPFLRYSLPIFSVTELSNIS